MKLLEPICIVPLQVKNRIVMAPMATYYADEKHTNRKLLLRRLGEKGVKIRVMTQAKAIVPEGIEVEFNGRTEV